MFKKIYEHGKVVFVTVATLGTSVVTSVVAHADTAAIAAAIPAVDTGILESAAGKAFTVAAIGVAILLGMKIFKRS